MYKAYILAAFLGLGLYGYSQYKGWSLMSSEAEEFQRRRAQEQYSSGSSGRTGSGSSYSGHK